MKIKKQKTPNFIEQTFFALGTVNSIKMNEHDNHEILESAIQRVYEIDDRMSAFKSSSDISGISRNAGKGLANVHRETFDLIKKAVAYSEISNGTFDITMRPVIALWGIHNKDNYVPTDSEIEQALKLVNYKDIIFDEKTCSIGLKKPGQAIDLGGIAKGYAADEVKRILLESGIKSALINLGGNVVTIGKKPDGEDWKVGIQNPLAPTGEYLGALNASDKTIVTSGSNERFFIKDGIRYHHIIDPRTGRPASSNLLSVTVIADSSIDADAVTTALFILGPDQSMEILKQLPVEFIFVTNDMNLLISNGLKGNFEIIRR